MAWINQWHSSRSRSNNRDECIVAAVIRSDDCGYTTLASGRPEDHVCIVLTSEGVPYKRQDRRREFVMDKLEAVLLRNMLNDALGPHDLKPAPVPTSRFPFRSGEPVKGEYE